VDGRFLGYVLGEWAELFAYARELCPDADVAETQELVLATLTRVGGRWRFVAGKDDLDSYVRGLLVRACVSRNERTTKESGDVLLMDVGFVGVPVAVAKASPTEMSPPDAVAVLTRRVGRVRRVRLIAAAGVVVVVAALALTLPGSGGSPRTGGTKAAAAKHRVARVAPRLVAFPQPLTDFAGGVTSGGGFIWTIENRDTRRGSRSYVVQRNPQSGVVVGRYVVPEADDHIGFGFGKAWTWHNNDDFPNTAIATIGETGSIETFTSTPPIAIDDMTFTAHDAWLTEPKINRVVRLTNGVLGADNESVVRGAKFVVPLGPSSVLVAGRTGTLHELPSGLPILAGKTAPTLLDPAPSYGFWLGFGRRVAYLSTVGGPENIRLTLPLAVAKVVGDPADGVYIALQSDDPLNHDPYLVYYSPTALEANHPQPTAHLDGLAQAEDLVVDPAGGVVFVTNEGTVEAWRPAGLAGQGQKPTSGLSTLG
jgi:hypothetical protein